ncbi:MAG: glycine cleavage system protein T [Hyphomicrobium sp. 32-62-53]|nr:MAG: glycine cleavage system protein T [Hyphomicrobium sp. 12-62-95]OYX97877.1 MAG: glycine cleavage system protein T [Hyphomicrobium sp. 32-62-53]
MTQSDAPQSSIKRTPLYAEHVRLGARMVPFAGYEMPVQYAGGIIEEHLWTRSQAGLFDISHMGQAVLRADDGKHETAARALEALVPADIAGLAPGQQRYTQILNATGGVIDDLMVTRPAEPGTDGTLRLVLNASRKEIDGAHIAQHLPLTLHLDVLPDAALLALQGPKAATVLSALWPGADNLAFMHAGQGTIASSACYVSRSGYTGEDGYEISVAAANIAIVWQALLDDPAVRPIGLGARDSLRLEAGLCLYGHELDETISPIEAGLAWSIQKRRRQSADFPGADRITRELNERPVRLRVGILPAGRAPARDGTTILNTDGAPIGHITSGGYSPTLKRPVAMGFVHAAHAAPGTAVKLLVRGSELDAEIVRLPFVPHAYRR